MVLAPLLRHNLRNRPPSGRRLPLLFQKTGVGAHDTIKEFIPAERLALAWHWEDEGSDEEEAVTVTFSDGHIHLEHGADSFDSCAMYQNVWTDILYRLKGVLTA